MSDDLVKRLRDDSGDWLTDLAADRIEELEAAIKRQARAARTLRDLTLAEVSHLQDKDRAEYFAAKTLNSEREANEILTNRIEELEAKLAEALNQLDSARHSVDVLEKRVAEMKG